jgi:hypothetical protein
MDRVALELQIDLEAHRHDHRGDANYPHDPYGEFESLARFVCLDSWEPDDQEHVYLAILNAQQAYLVGAWNFVTIARTILLRSESVKRATTSAYPLKTAAQRLLADAQSRVHALLPCRHTYPSRLRVH